MKKTILTALLASWGLAAGGAVADDSSVHNTQNTPLWTEYRGVPIADSHHLHPDVVAYKLVEMGYENLVGYETDQGLWKMNADKEGQNLTIWVNPYFGNVVKEEPIS